MVEKASYGQETIHNFLEKLARDVPTLPAGGCTVAMAGALASAMGRFVVRVTLRRHGDHDFREPLTGLLSRLDSLQKKCVETIDRDEKAYKRIIRSSQMPKSTKEEQAKREASLQKAKIAALSPPMDLVEHGLEMLRFSQILVEECYPAALADAGVVAEMAGACFRGGIWTARANLLAIRDRTLVEQRQELLDNLETEAEDLYQKIKEKLNERL